MARPPLRHAHVGTHWARILGVRGRAHRSGITVAQRVASGLWLVLAGAPSRRDTARNAQESVPPLRRGARSGAGLRTNSQRDHFSARSLGVPRNGGDDGSTRAGLESCGAPRRGAIGLAVSGAVPPGRCPVATARARPIRGLWWRRVGAPVCPYLPGYSL